MKKIVVASVAALSLVGLSGCGIGKMTEPFKDAPRSGVENGDPADLVRMPDGFSNAATKCDHGNRIYTLFHGDGAYGSIAVVPNDPTCANSR